MQAVSQSIAESPVCQQRAAPLLVKAARWVLARLGSLAMALTLLPALVLVLLSGTLVESWHGQLVAHRLVYATWWFTVLLALLFVNILFAALKKWPWQRHQTGFLITHLGLLTVISGGFLTASFGCSGLMFLVDSKDGAAQNFGLHSAAQMIDRNSEVIRVRRPARSADDEQTYAFETGPFAWSLTSPVSTSQDRLTTLLAKVAHPLPQSWSADLGEGHKLEVLTYYPHAKKEPFTAASVREGQAFAAVEFVLSAPELGALPSQWLACHESQRRTRQGPALVEFLAQNCLPGQLREFRQPPASKDLGKAGQLVLGIGSEARRFDVAAMRAGEPQSLGVLGWSVRLLDYLPNYQQPVDVLPIDPAISFELTAPGGEKLGFVTTARRAGDLFPLSGYAGGVVLPAGFWAWLHPPDPRYGDDSLRGLLQLATADDKSLWFRSWATRRGAATGEPMGLETTQEVRGDNQRFRLWAGMGLKLQILKYLPEAQATPIFKPLPEETGAADADSAPALQCRLTHGLEQVEFWLGRTESRLTAVTCGTETLEIGYHSALRELPFSLTLLRAEQRVETGQPAVATSWVRVTDTGQGSDEQPQLITLNQPLGHWGYRIYQAGFKVVGHDPNGRPICQSVLKVNDDPGLYLKYLGSGMVAVGIACMFWMRAYFFRAASTPGDESAGRKDALGRLSP